MRKLLGVFAVFAVVAPLFVSAAELKLRKPKAGEIGQQATCPVMNQQFTVGKDTPTVDHKGKPYFFCCDHCIKDFQKNPDKFAAASQAALKVRKPTAEELGKPARCAVMGSEFAVAADTSVIDYQGKPYYFCCEHCVADFQAKPDRFALR